MFLGDFDPAANAIDFNFTTTDSTGAAAALSSGSLRVYKDNGTTPLSTTGITLSASFASVVGLNHVRIAPLGAEYVAGSDYSVVLTVGTVDNGAGTDISAVGYVVGQFSVHNRSHLRPTTAGRTLDVSAGGEAGVDWANVGTQGSTVALTATTINSVAADGALRPTNLGARLDVNANGEAGIDWGNVGNPTTTLALTATTINSVAADGALRPTNLGARLDVSAGGEAGVDWANVGSPTTTQLLSGTTINSVQTLPTIGPAGSGLSNIPWNAAWDAEVQSEVDDAITASVKINSIYVLLDTEIATILLDTGTTIPNLIAALNNLSAAQVNAEVVDALNVDTYAEPGQATPAATTTLQLKIGYLYKAWRNRTTQTSSIYALYNDDTTTLGQKGSFSDDATTADRGEITTGP